MRYKVIGYPKCGNTWLRIMLNKLLTTSDSYKVNPVDYEWTHTIGSVDRGNSRKIYKSKKLKGLKRKNIIILIRDPRDVVVSLYHQLNGRELKRYNHNCKNIDEFVMNREFGFERVIKFYELIKNSLKHTNHIIITYEDLKTNGIETLQKVLKFMGKSISNKVVEEVYNECSFDRLSELEKKQQIEDLPFFGTEEENMLMMRKGIVGNYKNELKKKTIKYCNDILKGVNKTLNNYF